CVGMPLARCEDSQARQATESDEQSLERSPADALALGDCEHDGAEARCREQRSTQVEPPPARLLRVGRNDLQRGNREQRGDRKIDVEDHPPVAELGEDAADEDTDGGACASDCSPGGEGLSPRSEEHTSELQSPYDLV